MEPYIRASEVVLTGLFGGLAVASLISTTLGPFGAFIGLDYGHYVDAVRRWIDTGSPYLPNEVAGPFQFTDLTFLHPPIALLLFAPFLVLPAALFWVAPIAGTIVLIVQWQPARWTWPVIALLLNWPRFIGSLIVGNSDLWVCFFLAVALRFGWPALLLAMKPSLAPLAVAGLPAILMRREQRLGVNPDRLGSMAIVAVGLVFVGAAFGRLWLDWLAVVRNSPADPIYSVAAIPWLLVPVVAWVGRTRSPGRGTSLPHRVAGSSARARSGDGHDGQLASVARSVGCASSDIPVGSHR